MDRTSSKRFVKRCTSTGSLRRIAPLRNKSKKKDDDTLLLTWQSVSLDGLRPVKPLKSCLSVGNLSELDNENKMKKNVSFHKIEIHEHPRTLGDNPGKFPF
jgi:hypothetical protein